MYRLDTSKRYGLSRQGARGLIHAERRTLRTPGRRATRLRRNSAPRSRQLRRARDLDQAAENPRPLAGVFTPRHRSDAGSSATSSLPPTPSSSHETSSAAHPGKANGVSSSTSRTTSTSQQAHQSQTKTGSRPLRTGGRPAAASSSTAEYGGHDLQAGQPTQSSSRRSRYACPVRPPSAESGAVEAHALAARTR